MISLPLSTKDAMSLRIAYFHFYLFTNFMLHPIFYNTHIYVVYKIRKWSKITKILPNPEDIALMNKFRVISNDDNNSSKELKSFPTTMTLFANPPKLTSLSSARQIYHWPALNSVNLEFACFTVPFPPFHESFTVWKVLSPVINNSPMNRFPMSNSLHKSKFPVLSIIPLLCWIWPGFKQKSSLFLPTKSWNDTNMCALIFLLFHLIFLDDKIRTTVQLITCTVP